MDYGGRLCRVRIKEDRVQYVIFGRIVLADLPIQGCGVDFGSAGAFLHHRDGRRIRLRCISVDHIARLRQDLAAYTMDHGIYGGKTGG